MVPEVLAPEEVQLLTALGFAAAGAGLWRNASTVFEGLVKLRPHRAFPYIGQAVVLLNRQLPNEAAAALEKGQRVVSGADDMSRPEELGELQAWRGLALHLAGRGHESQLELDQAHRTGAVLSGAPMVATMLGKPVRHTSAQNEGDPS